MNAPSPPEIRAPIPASWRKHWWWYGVALGLLLAVDLLTTLLATHVHGLGAEFNPLMRLLLHQGVVITVLVHLFVAVIATLGFAHILQIGSSLEGVWRERYRMCCELWLAALLVVGVVVAANNLAVVAVGVVGA